MKMLFMDVQIYVSTSVVAAVTQFIEMRFQCDLFAQACTIGGSHVQ